MPTAPSASSRSTPRAASAPAATAPSCNGRRRRCARRARRGRPRRTRACRASPRAAAARRRTPPRARGAALHRAGAISDDVTASSADHRRDAARRPAVAPAALRRQRRGAPRTSRRTCARIARRPQKSRDRCQSPLRSRRPMIAAPLLLGLLLPAEPPRTAVELSRRSALCGGLAAAFAAPVLAADDVDAAKQQIASSLVAVDDLLARYDDITAEQGGDGIRRVLGTIVSANGKQNSPLWRVDRAAKLIAAESSTRMARAARGIDG